MYFLLKDFGHDVEWKQVLKGNVARARAVQMLWLACHERLPTKARLCKLKLLAKQDCVFCGEVEYLDHLLFKCAGLRTIWECILSWLDVDHNPDEWKMEVMWMNTQRRKKGGKFRILQCAFAETCKNAGGIETKRVLVINRVKLMLCLGS
ncbi:uncharacterized protein LOC131632884 [Vicia villosa]|uniref:uncharacterized protein LOC131632884 n=1 Tax=Vicia villosa TaxID=3911 RepID=UPI00273C5CCF|nr:uncharacterized protein LOC131632884 [Vicia villosa]